MNYRQRRLTAIETELADLLYELRRDAHACANCGAYQSTDLIEIAACNDVATMLDMTRQLKSVWKEPEEE